MVVFIKASLIETEEIAAESKAAPKPSASAPPLKILRSAQRTLHAVAVFSDA